MASRVDDRGAGDARRWLGDQRGSFAPAYLGLIFVTMAAAVGLFQVGHAAVMRSSAQTASDAGALAAANLAEQVITERGGDLHPGFTCEVFRPWAEEAAGSYAARNDAVVREVALAFSPKHLCTVTVRVVSADQLGEHWSHDRTGDRARGHARARAAVMSWTPPGGFVIPTGGTPSGAGWRLTGDPEQVAVAMLDTARQIAGQGHRFMPGAGHGTTPVPSNLGAYDASSSVSMLLQQAGVDVPTMHIGQWAAAGQSASNTFVRPGAGQFLTLWVQPAGQCGASTGSMFVDLAGRGWGTGPGNPGGGPGWLPSATPGACMSAYHLPELEEGLDPEFLAGLTPAGSNASHPGSFGWSTQPRLIEVE